jgi:FecR protein/CARDB
MTVVRPVRVSACALLLLAATASLSATPQSQTSPQPVAGKITALIPTGAVLREKKSFEAKQDMAVLWQDTVKTERGGRARLRLEDGSILNVGSQASLLVTKHDPGKQQTDLELIYGKVRADVTKIATPDGHFEIRTKVAVCGVVGTEEYLEATEFATTVIALGGGQVRVASADPRLGGVTLLNPGEAVSVLAGKPPGPKRLATSEELSKAVQDTEGETGATIDPGASVAGRTFDAVITGKDLSATQSVSSTQAGISVKTRGEITATQIPVTITIAPNVPVGAYPLTINRPQGPAVAGFAVASQGAIQLSQSPGAGLIQVPPSQEFNVTQGAKIPLDASATRTPPGTQIVTYQWSVPNTSVTGTGSAFSVNTSALAPGNYNVVLTVVSDSGQVGTQQYPLVVQAGVQPVEIVRDLASAYESLQPTAFLKNFDEERFRNYAGFAAAIEDSFQTKLETIRVFQRPVNCAVVELQDDGVCQAEFRLQFTLKNQPTVLLDDQGNPIPAGTPPPANARTGKQILTGSEQATIRFHRGDTGWKIVDYGAIVNCPNGSATGVNVGSCLLAIGSSISPSFQLVNVQLFSTDLPLGGSVSGTFTVSPAGGFNGSVNFSGQGQVGNQPVTVQFSPNPSGPMATVNFTVFAPTSAPTGINGPTQFTLILMGRDTSGAITATANAIITLQPDFSLSLTPATTSSSPAAVTQNSTLPVTVQVVGGAGFTGTVFIDFPNLPAGFSATPGNLAAGAQGSFPITVSAAASPGPALITVRGTTNSGAIRTATLFLNVISDFTLQTTPATSATNPAGTLPGGTLQVGVQVVPISGFAGTVAIDFPNLPAGFTATGGNVAGGATVTFPIQNTLQAGPTIFQITIRGRFGNDVQSILLFVQVKLSLPILPGPKVAAVVASQATVYAMEPVKLKAGDLVEAKLYGANLGAVTSVQVSGSGIKAELLESLASELRVRFTVDPNLEPGSRLMSLQAGGTKAGTTAIDVGPAGKSSRVLRVPDQALSGRAEPDNPAAPAARDDSSGTPDLVIGAQDFTMTPTHPKPGDAVLFHLLVRNAGTAAVQDAAIEFSIAGTTVKQRETVSLAPGGSESFDFEWKAAGAGRLEPRAVIDPENLIPQMTRSGKTAVLQSFELVGLQAFRDDGAHAKLDSPSRIRQRGDMRLVVGGCTGFRLTSGTEQSCGGSADLEVSSRGGTTLVIEAEGVRNLGGMPLDQADSAASEGLSSSASLTPGNTYLVRSRHGAAIVRVVQIRGIESVRNAPPAALRGPRMGGADREVQGNSGPPELTLVLEWKTLQQ